MPVRTKTPPVVSANGRADEDDLVFSLADLNSAHRLLRKDLKTAAESLTIRQVRYFCDTYYSWQEFRKASANQVRALTAAGEPNLALQWALAHMLGLEKDVQAMLDHWTMTEPTGVGAWMRDITGIGPVIAAGLLAHIDIERAPTVGHIWRLGGMDPTIKWLGREGGRKLVADAFAATGAKEVTPEVLAYVAQRTNRTAERIVTMATDKESGVLKRATIEAGLARRPWNASLKVILFKLASSFVYVSGNPKDVYGKWYIQRKTYELLQNEKGAYAGQARAKLETTNIGKETEAYKWYSAGKLPPAHIHARAMRWTAKLFVSHLHEEMYVRRYGTPPPLPYPLKALGHQDYIPRPNPSAGYAHVPSHVKVGTGLP